MVTLFYDAFIKFKPGRRGGGGGWTLRKIPRNYDNKLLSSSYPLPLCLSACPFPHFPSPNSWPRKEMVHCEPGYWITTGNCTFHVNLELWCERSDLSNMLKYMPTVTLCTGCPTSWGTLLLRVVSQLSVDQYCSAWAHFNKSVPRLVGHPVVSSRPTCCSISLSSSSTQAQTCDDTGCCCHFAYMSPRYRPNQTPKRLSTRAISHTIRCTICCQRCLAS
jgi:hypothetical protein